jgi:multiple sugar transport system permease protein
MSRRTRREALEFYISVSPWIIGFIIFTAYPIGFSLFLSFHEWNLLESWQYVGLSNYITMFTEDGLFRQSLKVTAIYTGASVPLGICVALILAALLNRPSIRGLSVFRTIFYLPSVTSGVAVAILWMWIFNPDFGIINYFLKLLGINGPPWLASEEWVLPALIIMSLWGIGGSMIIFLAGLQGVPQELYESAELDGATGWHKFRYITIPLITPVILFNLITGVIGSFQTFTQAYIMTNGGPNNASLFYILNLYNQSFRNMRMGYGCALAWVLFLVILICSLVLLWTSNKWVYYEGGILK